MQAFSVKFHIIEKYTALWDNRSNSANSMVTIKHNLRLKEQISNQMRQRNSKV